LKDLGRRGKTLRDDPCLTVVTESRFRAAFECGIDVREQSELTAASFVLDYVALGKPVLVRAAAGGSASLGAWFSAERWTRHRLRERHSGEGVEVGDIPHAAASGLPSKVVPLGEYVETILETSSGGASSRAIAVAASRVDERGSLAHGFDLPQTSFLDPAVTGLAPDKVHLSLGPSGSGSPMRFSRAAIDLLARGSRTWLLQAPSEAVYSSVHPMDATAHTPWPWPTETLYSCQQEAGDVIYFPDMWGRAMLNEEESLGFLVEMETGANDFSITVE